MLAVPPSQGFVLKGSSSRSNTRAMARSRGKGNSGVRGLAVMVEGGSLNPSSSWSSSSSSSPSPTPHATVVFLRHGQSVWNEASLFTGWADVELTTLGKNEAAKGATEMWKEGLEFDVAYTSLLTRAQQTLDIALTIMGQEDTPVNKDWRLNERMYGGLTALNKKETAAKYGADQVKEWRRSYDTPPPPVDKTSDYWPGNDDKYAHIPDDQIPLSECLKDTVDRTLPYWDSAIAPALKRGKTVLVAAHGNSIRGMLKVLDDIADDGITDIEIPTAIPLVYQLDKDLKPIQGNPRAVSPLSGYFLTDPEELAKAQAAVAAQSVVSSSSTDGPTDNELDIGKPSTVSPGWEELSPPGDDHIVFTCLGDGCLMLGSNDMREAFDKFDADKDGTITQHEFRTTLLKLAADGDLGPDEVGMEELNTLFDAVDRDHNGLIDYEEFVQAVTADR